MDYHITATASGDKLDLFQSDWLMLLELAHKYDFDPDGGMDFYLYETPEIVPAPISHAIANALRSAARYLPDRTIGVLVSQKAGELFAYIGVDFRNPENNFTGVRRWIVAEFIELLEQGEVEVERVLLGP